MIIMIRIEGEITPKAAVTAPETPLALLPTMIAMLLAMMPGMHWLTAKKSNSSSFVSQ